MPLLLPLTSTGPCRFVLGEGIEKKTNDLAKEVEEQTKAFEEAAAKKAAAAPESDAPAPEAAAEPAQVLWLYSCMPWQPRSLAASCTYTLLSWRISTSLFTMYPQVLVLCMRTLWPTGSNGQNLRGGITWVDYMLAVQMVAPHVGCQLWPVGHSLPRSTSANLSPVIGTSNTIFPKGC